MPMMPRNITSYLVDERPRYEWVMTARTYQQACPEDEHIIHKTLVPGAAVRGQGAKVPCQAESNKGLRH